MGIVPTSCRANTSTNKKTLTLDGRVQEFAATKEVIRQLVLAVEGDLVSNMDWLFQRTLSSTCPAAVWPVPPSRQFYCPTSGTLTRTLNTVEGADAQNFKQPNFLYIMTDSPVKVTFGYDDSATRFRDAGGLITAFADYSGTHVGTVLATVAAGHNLVPGTNSITISSSQEAAFNGTFTATYVNSTQFYFTAAWPVVPPSPLTGILGAGLSRPLLVQPYNLNFTVVVNGYLVKTASKSTIKVAPGASGEPSVWGASYSGGLGDDNTTWNDCVGKSDAAITFPIRVEKSSQISESRVTIYAAVLA